MPSHAEGRDVETETRVWAIRGIKVRGAENKLEYYTCLICARYTVPIYGREQDIDQQKNEGEQMHKRRRLMLRICNRNKDKIL
jgi:hypothetical protein